MTKILKVGVLAALLLAGSMWCYVQHVLIVHQEADAVARGAPRGNLSDLYPRWLGARELLLHHRDPYSAEITREIQVGYYGRALDPTRYEDPKDQQAFAYPVYVVFLLAPTVGFPFELVQSAFRWFLPILTVLSVLLWLRALRWRPSSAAVAITVILTLGSFQVLQAIKLQQLTLLVSGLIAAVAMLLSADYLAAAGVLLALATIKPQLTLLLAIWLLLWALSDWHRRQGFVWGFILTMAGLVAAGEYVLPGWLGRFRHAITSYQQYAGESGSVLDAIFTPVWGRIIALLIVLIFAVICWRCRRFSADSTACNLALVLSLAWTVAVVPKAAPYNQILLLPGILFLLQHWRILWTSHRLARFAIVISGLLLGWTWLAAAALTAASVFLPAQSIQEAWSVPLWTILWIPIAIPLLLVSRIGAVARSH